MLRINSRCRRTPASLLGCLAILIAVAIPGIGQAASTTSTLGDLFSGVTVTATFDDAITPGSVSLTLDVEPRFTTGGGPDPGRGASLTGFFLRIADDAFPDLIVSGSDVFDNGYFDSNNGPSPCPCFSITDLGSNGIFDPTRIRSTTLNLAHESLPLSLADLGGSSYLIALHVPGASSRAPSTLVKLRGEIPVIPEPTTGALLLLGLMGLAGNSKRHPQNPR